jgi:hypothetical protein
MEAEVTVIYKVKVPYVVRYVSQCEVSTTKHMAFSGEAGIYYALRNY